VSFRHCASLDAVRYLNLGLWGVGHGALAVVFGCAAAASELLLYTLGDPLAGERGV
jgi:hypothetical protein